MWVWCVDVLCVLMFTADIYVQRHKGFFSYGQFIFDFSLIRKNYFKSKGILDVICTIPFGWIFLAMGMDIGNWFRFNHCWRLPRIFSLYRLRTPLLDQSLKVRFFQYAIVGAVGFHWIGCGWLLVNDYKPGPDFPVQTIYIEAIYWSVTTLTTVGYGDITPFNDLARVYTMVVMILGVGVYAFVIGNISSLLVKVDAIEEANKRKLTLLADYMDRCDVPEELRGKVFGYYHHFLETHPSRENQGMLKELPTEIRKTLETYSHLKLINAVPMLKELSDGCREELASNLELVVYSPKEDIVRYGESGHEMFFVDHGNVEILDPTGQRIKALEAGDHFFRETALQKEPVGKPRVRAINYCGLYRLDEVAFQRTVLRHGVPPDEGEVGEKEES